MASFVFDNYAENMLGEGATRIDFDTDTIKVRVVSDSDYASPDRTATVMTGITGYASSTDATISSPTIGVVSARTIDAADAAMGSFNQDGSKTIDMIVIYKFVTNDADSIPMILIDLTTSATPNGNAVTVQWNASGIMTLDA